MKSASATCPQQEKAMLKGILIDFGGVLVRTKSQETRRSWEKRLDLKDGGLSDIIFDSQAASEATLGKVSYDAVWQNVASVLHMKRDDLLQLKDDYFALDVLDEELIDGLQHFRPDTKIGILSNAWSNARILFSNQFHLIDKVDQMIISAEEGLAKPDPRIYKLASKRISLEPTEIVFIDDKQENVDGAKQVGMQAITFSSTNELLETLKSMLIR